jgi:hypothetical protein
LDKAWKAHERAVAEFFGTRRALHGVDRDQGQVLTDVFVDGSNLVRGYPIAEDYAIFIECKYTGKGSSSNAWMLSEIAEIARQMKKDKKEIRSLPGLRTRDGWTWIRLEDFETYLPFLTGKVKELPGPTPSESYLFKIVEKNKKMSKFFYNAIEQAKLAELPKRPGKPPYTHRMHLVCVGSNLRVAKCVGIPPESIVKL